MPNIYLTDHFIKKAICPNNKTQELYWDHPQGADGKIYRGARLGLGLRITKHGNMSFVHAYRLNGKRRRVVIGDAARMNVGSARLLIDKRELQIDNGLDPDAEKIDYRAKHAPTVGDIVERYWLEHVSTLSDEQKSKFVCYIASKYRDTSHGTRRGRNTVANRVDFERRYRDVKIEDIKPDDVKEFLDQYSSPSTWNGAYRLVRALFNWAIRMQIVDMRNPCSPFRAKTVLKQRRDYSPDQIKAIADYIFSPVIEPLISTESLFGVEMRDAALANGRIKTRNAQMIELCNFMGILFLTMARPTELKQAEFSHFDAENCIWHKHHTKGIKLSRAASEYAFRSVPVHPKVIELVKQQQGRWSDASLVFPSHTDPALPRDNFRKVILPHRIGPPL